MQRTTAFILALLWSIVSVPAVAAPLFTLDIDIKRPDGSMLTPEPVRFSFDNFEDLINDLDEDELKETFRGYDEKRDTVDANIDFRGLEAKIKFDPEEVTEDGGEGVLVFEVLAGEEVIVSEKFTDGDQDELVEEVEAFLTGEGDTETLNSIQAASIEHSPVDPIAGNPGSLANNQLSGQFQEGFSDQASRIAAPERSSKSAGPENAGESRDPENHVLLGVRFGRYTAGDRHSAVFTLPLGYSFRLKEGGRGLQKVAIDFPITYAEIEGAEGYAASIGGSMTWGITNRWSLSPAIGVGVTGSLDLVSGGGIGSVSLTSAYTVPFERFDLSIGNMVGYYETLKIEIGDYQFDPGISNMAFRNGLILSIPGTMGRHEVATEVWATDTRFTGDALYSEYQHEFGVSFGLAKSDKFTILHHLRAGVSYMTGDNVSGYALRLGYSF